MRRTLLLLAFLLGPIPHGPAASPLWTVDLHDVTDREELEGRADYLLFESLEFTPDGESVVTAGHFYHAAKQQAAGEVRVRSASDGSTRAKLHGKATSYARRAGALDVAPSGHWIAAIGRDENGQDVVEVFELRKHRLARSLQGTDRSPLVCLRFSPDGRILAAAHMSGTVEFWDYREGRKLTEFHATGSRGVRAIAFTPDGRFLATGNRDASVSIWPVEGAERVAHSGAIEDLAFVGAVALSNGRLCMAAGGFPRVDGHSPISLWNVVANESGVELREQARLTGHEEHTYALAFSPDGRYLASANQDTTVRIWNVEQARELAVITYHTDFAYDVAFSPEGSRLATLSRDSLRLWNLAELVETAGHAKPGGARGAGKSRPEPAQE